MFDWLKGFNVALKRMQISNWRWSRNHVQRQEVSVSRNHVQMACPEKCHFYFDLTLQRRLILFGYHMNFLVSPEVYGDTDWCTSHVDAHRVSFLITKRGKNPSTSWALYSLTFGDLMIIEFINCSNTRLLSTISVHPSMWEIIFRLVIFICQNHIKEMILEIRYTFSLHHFCDLPTVYVRSINLICNT